MTRTVDDIQASMIAKVPPGWALGFRGGVLDALLKAPASEFQLLEDAIARMMDEFDPRTARVLLPDFERVLGPDPCGRDVSALPLNQRQRIAHQRWTALGGQSLPYLISVAADLGFSIEIEELWPSKAGWLRAGQRLIPEGEQFIWWVRLHIARRENFKAGASQAGDPLGRFFESGVECELRRIAHAHTIPVFSYILEEEAA